MDILGFFTITKKKSKVQGETKIDTIALSHNKERVCQLLTTFCSCPDPHLLSVKTSYFYDRFPGTIFIENDATLYLYFSLIKDQIP